MSAEQQTLFDARRDGREGMVTVVDYEGRIAGSMGVETWQRVLDELSERAAESQQRLNVDAATEHISLVLQTARRDAANRVAGPNALTHAYTYLELLRAEIERLSVR